MYLYYCPFLLFPVQKRQPGKLAVYICCWTSLSCVLQTSGSSRFYKSYVKNLCPHACPTVSSNCWHVLPMYMRKTRVLENKLWVKHDGLFSSLGLLQQEQLALCRGHQLHTHRLTGDLFWASLLQKQNENSQQACVYCPLSRQYFATIVIRVNFLRFAELLRLGIVFYTVFSTLEKIITSTHLTGMQRW